MSKKLFIFEDNPDLKEILKTTFEQRGYSVTATTSFPLALKESVSEKFDIAVLDLMDRHDNIVGLRLAESLKTGNPHTYTILVTGCRTEEIQSMQKGRTIDSVLHKPFSLKELSKLIQKKQFKL